MFETVLKLYYMAMATGVTSPVPHLVGPPGCGKSTVVQLVADMLGVNLHIINVSRLSPLEVEGVQMPATDEHGVQSLEMLLSTMWSRLKPGDIILFDEFLRGFPEVYNALLDIITARHVAGHDLPPVFMMAASNSMVAYDKALEDRLHHLPVPDPRNNKGVKRHLAQLIVDQLGLNPDMVKSVEMTQLLEREVFPMFKLLDDFKKKASSPGQLEGTSVRKLIGMAQLRDVKSNQLVELIDMNNHISMRGGYPQFVFLLSGKDAVKWPDYTDRVSRIADDKLTEVQRINRTLNLQLIEMEAIRNERGGEADDAVSDDDLEAQFS